MIWFSNDCNMSQGLLRSLNSLQLNLTLHLGVKPFRDWNVRSEKQLSYFTLQLFNNVNFCYNFSDDINKIDELSKFDPFIAIERQGCVDEMFFQNICLY